METAARAFQPVTASIVAGLNIVLDCAAHASVALKLFGIILASTEPPYDP